MSKYINKIKNNKTFTTMTREQFNTIKEQLPKFTGRETKYRTVSKYTGKEEFHTGVIIGPNPGVKDHIQLGRDGFVKSIHFSRIDFPETIQA